jgi:hypothetical protein
MQYLVRATVVGIGGYYHNTGKEIMLSVGKINIE